MINCVLKFVLRSKFVSSFQLGFQHFPTHFCLSPRWTNVVPLVCCSSLPIWYLGCLCFSCLYRGTTYLSPAPILYAEACPAHFHLVREACCAALFSMDHSWTWALEILSLMETPRIFSDRSRWCSYISLLVTRSDWHTEKLACCV